MKQIVRSSGIIKAHLFRVDGYLKDNYNRALEKMTGKTTNLNSFYVDKRGESLEIKDELGQFYLQTGPAHRYCIVVSPDQSQAGLLHEEFSFDHQLIDFIYQNHLPAISVATRVDALCGEINDNVRHYDSIEDLLLIKSVHLELHTPSGFLTKARNLQQYIRDLRKDAGLLIKDDCAVPKMIQQLVKEVGDVRNYNLSPIRADRELQTFYTRLFDGVYVFGGIGISQPVDIKRPAWESEILFNADEKMPVVPEAPKKTIVIYNRKDRIPEDGPSVQFIPLQETELVVNFLLSNNLAEYDADLLDHRLSRTEDETLLLKGHPITEMDQSQKNQALHQYYKEMPGEWNSLREIKRRMTVGHDFENIAKSFSPDIRAMLLTPVTNDPAAAFVVQHLLTRIYPFNYEKMYDHNMEDLKKIYDRTNDKRKKYIRQLLEEQNRRMREHFHVGLKSVFN